MSTSFRRRKKAEPFLFDQGITDARLEELIRLLDERAVSHVGLNCQGENDHVLGRYGLDLRRHSFVTWGRHLGGGGPIALFLLGYERHVYADASFQFGEPQIEFTRGRFLSLHQAEDQARQPLLDRMDEADISAFKGRIARARSHRTELLTLMQHRTRKNRAELFKLMTSGTKLAARQLKEEGFATDLT